MLVEVTLMGTKQVFSKEVKKEILELLDKDVDEKGIIIEKDKPEQKVLTIEGEEISFEKFGGVRKGSEVFIKDNLVSLIKLSKR